MTVTYDASRVTLVDHPLVQHKLSILRDKSTGTNQFRQLVRELALFDGYEAMRDLPMEDVEVETPITTATFKQLAGKKLAIVPILRAGLGMVDGIPRPGAFCPRGPHWHGARRGHPRAA